MTDPAPLKTPKVTPEPKVKVKHTRAPKSDEHRKKLSDAVRAAYVRKREANYERDQRMIKEYVEDWMTIRELAEKYGTTKPTITSILNYYDTPIRGNRETKASIRLENNLEQIIEDYKGGMSRLKVAKKWDVAESTLSRALRDADVEMRPPHFINQNHPRFTSD